MNMEEQHKVSEKLLVPKTEILEELEITFDSDWKDKELITPKEEPLSYLDDGQPETHLIDPLKPIKLEQTMSAEIVQLRHHLEPPHQTEVVSNVSQHMKPDPDAVSTSLTDRDNIQKLGRIANPPPPQQTTGTLIPVTPYVCLIITPSTKSPTDNLRRETKTVKTHAQRQKEYRERKKIAKQLACAKKIPKTNAQRQQEFRQKQKNKALTEASIIARRQMNADRAKRYRDKLKSKRQFSEFDSSLASLEADLPT